MLILPRCTEKLRCKTLNLTVYMNIYMYTYLAMDANAVIIILPFSRPELDGDVEAQPGHQAAPL